MWNISFRQLQAVAAIARCGSVSGAARDLRLTPSALTTRLKHLEDEVGLLLFDRGSAGLTPTDAGREMLLAVDSVWGVLDACAERLQAIKGIEAGRVSVSIVTTAKYFIPFIVGGFVAKHPGVEVVMKVGNRGETIEALRSYGSDLAVMGRPPRDVPIEADAFGENPLVLIAPPKHRLVGRRRLTRADLADESFLMRENGSGTRLVFEEFMSGLMIKRARLGIDAGSNETIKQAVMAGLGIALISGHTVAHELGDGRLATLDVAGLPIRREWFVVRRAEKVLGPAAKAFWTYLVENGRDWLPAKV